MIAISIKQFLVTEQRCPDEWIAFDLYLFRDDQTVFYVGQSESAFNRVWEHFFDGFKGRSTIGRFILCNWPVSMKFSIELWNSAHDHFAAVNHDRSSAEQLLIEQYAPCFNITLNQQPHPLPAQYLPTTAKPKCSRSPRKLIMEASIALQADQRRAWLANSDFSG